MDYIRRGSLSSSSSSYEENAWRRWVVYAILLYINLLMYTDRYSLPGILNDIQATYELKDDLAGVIFSTFLAAYTIGGPIFGYFGDRYNRTIIVIISIIAWNAANLSCSFAEKFWLFLLLRGLLGCGQAGFATVAPTLIADLFMGTERLFLLTLFYTCIPVGNGFGYIAGAEATRGFGNWRWSMRITQPFSVLSIVLIILFMKEPKRGQVDGTVRVKKTTLCQDLKYLLTNKSYMFTSLAFTFVAFTLGALHWWIPLLNYRGLIIHDPNASQLNESSTIGSIGMIAGFIGLWVGYGATFYLKKKDPTVVPAVCGLGVFISVPLIVGTTFLSLYNRTALYTCYFIGYVFMNLNWALTADISMDVVIPPNRSLAVGMQLLIGHALGDVGSPYFTGLISDKLREYYNSKSDDKLMNDYHGLQHAFIIATCFEFIGAIFFFLNAYYYVDDIKKAERDLAEMESN